MGLAEDRLPRLKAPAGLDIHGIEPAEIALSIIAEFVERRRRDLQRDALGDLRPGHPRSNPESARSEAEQVRVRRSAPILLRNM
jgi:xanthine/CO dehydrogenase XdhC/CoxF family maturation factor